MGLAHAVITCVARDDLADGGAGGFAATIAAIRRRSPADHHRGAHLGLQGRRGVAARPSSRPAPTSSTTTSRRWPGSSGRCARRPATPGAWPCWPGPRTPGSPPSRASSSGMGEGEAEVLATLADLRAVGVDIVTIGQYLRPSRRHLPVARWWTPEEFESSARAGMAMGFSHVQASPLTRSSYHARQAAEAALDRARRRPPVAGARRVAAAVGRERPNGLPTERSRPASSGSARVRERMGELGVDALLLSHGADLPWLTGYRAMPLERLTMLVLPAEGDPLLVVPGPRGAPGRRGRRPVRHRAVGRRRGPDRPVVSALGGRARRRCRPPPGRVRPGLGHLRAGPPAAAARGHGGSRPRRSPRPSGPSRTPPRWGPADGRGRRRPGGGGAAGGRDPPDRSDRGRGVRPHLAPCWSKRATSRSTSPSSAAGPTPPVPTTSPGARVIGRGETVVCDFGGTYSLDGDVGYCSDITRTVVTGAPARRGRPTATGCWRRPSGRRWPRPGPASPPSTSTRWRGTSSRTPVSASCSSTAPATGSASRSTRTPTWCRGTARACCPGHAFSVEPGIYRARPVRHAAGGHRGDRGRRSTRTAQLGRPRPGRGRR